MKEILGHCNLLINLPTRTIEEISKHISVKKYGAGQIILEREQQNDSIFFVFKGRVEVLILLQKKEVKITELGPAEAFGEMSFIDNFITSARVRALEETQVGRIRKQNVIGVLSQDAEASSKFWETLCQIIIRRYWVLLEQTYKIFREYFKTHESL